MSDPNTTGTRAARAISRHPLRTALLAGAAVLALSAGVQSHAAFERLPQTMASWSARIVGAAAPAQAHAAEATSDRRQGFADVVARVRSSVVSVRVKAEAAEAQPTADELPAFPPGSPWERFFRQFRKGQGEGRPQIVQAQGSGFFISADGYVVTNNHVVERAKQVTIVTDAGKELKARVVGTDPKTDLAVLKVDEGSAFPFVRLSETPPRVGDWVIAIGNPFGLGGTVTAGIVSARGRDIGAGPYDDFIQIDAPVNRGNSGGPTFNVDGDVVGVNTAIVSPSGGSVGIGFAIPAETVAQVVKEIEAHGGVNRGWLGVSMQPVTPEIADGLGLKETAGVLVAQIDPAGPAAKAGLRPGDVVTALDGRPLADPKALARAVGGHKPGEALKLGYVRDGKPHETDVRLDEQRARSAAADRSSPGRAEMPHLGLALAPASRIEGAGDAGLAVVAVDPGGAAAERGVRPGDVILRIGSERVDDIAALRNALEAAKQAGRKAALAYVRHGETEGYVALPLG